MSSQHLHTVRDGSTVRIDPGETELEGSVSSVATCIITRDDQPVEFTANTHPLFAETAARDVAGTPLDESYFYRNRVLLSGTSLDSDGVLTRTAAWRGEFCSLYLIAYGSWGESFARVVQVFDSLLFEDSPEGLVLFRGTPPQGLDFRPPQLAKVVSNFGLLDIAPLNKETQRTIPPWAGKQVRGGELYRDELGPSYYYMLVSDTCRTNIYPQRHLDGKRLQSALETLVVE